VALIRPTVGKIVLKNVRELAAHLLSTARDHDHIESRLQAIRHAFIQSSENLSVPVTVVGNDQWFYSWLETARANEKEKIFPIRVDKSLNPKSTVDLVPVLTEKLERIFQSLHADDAGECEKNRMTTFEYVV
jgi:DNA-directed RNA polymerase